MNSTNRYKKKSDGNGPFWQQFTLIPAVSASQIQHSTVKDWKPDMTHNISQIHAVITVHTV